MHLFPNSCCIVSLDLGCVASLGIHTWYTMFSCPVQWAPWKHTQILDHVLYDSTFPPALLRVNKNKPCLWKGLNQPYWFGTINPSGAVLRSVKCSASIHDGCLLTRALLFVNVKWITFIGLPAAAAAIPSKCEAVQHLKESISWIKNQPEKFHHLCWSSL